jgi:DNA-binding HxlR family transcriptional regulator
MVEKGAPCPIEATMRLIGGKWRVLILRELFRGGIKRFGQLYKGIDGISQNMLAQQLRGMEKDGLLTRKAYPEVPPRVEYSMTRLGRSLRSVMSAIHEWGTEHKIDNG